MTPHTLGVLMVLRVLEGLQKKEKKSDAESLYHKVSHSWLSVQDLVKEDFFKFR